MVQDYLLVFFLVLVVLGSTLRRAVVEPVHQIIFVLIEEIDVGLDHFEALQQRAAAGTDVDIAEERLNTFQVEWVVEVRHGGHDESADGERCASERWFDHTPTRLQLTPHQERSHRISCHVLHYCSDVLHSNWIVLHGKVKIPVYKRSLSISTQCRLLLIFFERVEHYSFAPLLIHQFLTVNVLHGKVEVPVWKWSIPVNTQFLFNVICYWFFLKIVNILNLLHY